MIESNTAARARRVARSPWFPVLIGLLLGVALMLTLAALSGGVAGTDGSETATKDSTAKGGPLSVLGTIYEIVESLARDLGKAVLLVDQDIRAALAITDYVYVVKTGSIFSEGAREDFGTDTDALVARWLYASGE